MNLLGHVATLSFKGLPGLSVEAVPLRAAARRV